MPFEPFRAGRTYDAGTAGGTLLINPLIAFMSEAMDARELMIPLRVRWLFLGCFLRHDDNTGRPPRLDCFVQNLSRLSTAIMIFNLMHRSNVSLSGSKSRAKPCC